MKTVVAMMLGVVTLAAPGTPFEVEVLRAGKIVKLTGTNPKSQQLVAEFPLNSEAHEDERRT